MCGFCRLLCALVERRPLLANRRKHSSAFGHRVGLEWSGEAEQRNIRCAVARRVPCSTSAGSALLAFDWSAMRPGSSGNSASLCHRTTGRTRVPSSIFRQACRSLLLEVRPPRGSPRICRPVLACMRCPAPSVRRRSISATTPTGSRSRKELGFDCGWGEAGA